MKTKKYFISGFCVVMLILSNNLWGNLIDNCFFSNKGYANCIQAYGWVVTEDQVAEVFTKKEDPIRLSCKDLDKEYLYFLIRLENLSYMRAWGNLLVNCPDIGSKTVGVFDVSPCINRREYYAIPIGKICFSQSDRDKIPHLDFKWKKLYTQ